VNREQIVTTGQDVKPVPVPQIDSVPFFEAAAQGRLELQRCADCERFQFPPRLICVHCSSRSVVWTVTSGRGTVYSFTVVWRPPTPAFADDVPYTVALIDLDEGPRMMTNIVECDCDAVFVGQRVQARFAERGDQTIVMFAPEAGGA
jgi:uncharacterized OB-fold protein